MFRAGGIGSRHAAATGYAMAAWAQSLQRATPNRETWVSKIADQYFNKFNGKYSVVVIKEDNLENDWRNKVQLIHTQHIEYYPDSSLGSIGFRVIVCKGGILKNNGDGGFVNWIIKGYFNKNGNTVHFDQR